MPYDLTLHHGTTLDAAQAIVATGWVFQDPSIIVEAVAAAHGHTEDDLWRELSTATQTYALAKNRGREVSFSLDFATAGYSWAQRAPEIRREALWSVWRLENPDAAAQWTTTVEGHQWVLAHMRVTPPAVVSVGVDLRELHDWEAESVAWGGREPLSQVTFIDSIPEIAVPHELTFPEEDLQVTVVDRVVEWDVFALLLDLEQADFIDAAEAGAFGPKGDSYVRGPGSLPAWWPLSQVEEAVAAMRAGFHWDQLCKCLGP